MLVVTSKEQRQHYRVPWYRSLFRFSVWRSPEAGIAYLQWAAALKNDEDWLDKNDPSWGQPSAQALAAQETLLLYQWWKTIRPNRPDPREASGWSKFCEENHHAAKARGDDPIMASFTDNKIANERSRYLLDRYRELEKAQEEEDTAMLIRLIKVRQNLWT